MASYSIVICTYNGQNTISQAMDAILSLHLYDTHVKYDGSYSYGRLR